MYNVSKVFIPHCSNRELISDKTASHHLIGDLKPIFFPPSLSFSTGLSESASAITEPGLGFCFGFSNFQWGNRVHNISTGRVKLRNLFLCAQAGHRGLNVAEASENLEGFIVSV